MAYLTTTLCDLLPMFLIRVLDLGREGTEVNIEARVRVPGA